MMRNDRYVVFAHVSTVKKPPLSDEEYMYSDTEQGGEPSGHAHEHTDDENMAVGHAHGHTGEEILHVSDDGFSIVGIRETDRTERAVKRRRSLPVISMILLAVIILGCIGAPFLTDKDPAYLDLMNYSKAPNREFLFGTDTLGRDIFACIWYGGRISLTIGFLATLLSTMIAVLYGSVSGFGPSWLDNIMMRLTEILLSVPTLLLTIFLQAVLGNASVWSLSAVIGLTSWCSIAKVVRTEVRQIRGSGYVIASRCMGGGFFHVLRRHLAPNFVSSIMFMVVMNVRSAIAMESTLSFMGMGLSIEIISWGSMLSMAEKAMLSGSWWIILIPGVFLITVMMCMTNIGNYLRRSVNQKERVL